MTFRRLDAANAKGKRALVRVDFNVPMHDGKVTDRGRRMMRLPLHPRRPNAGISKSWQKCVATDGAGVKRAPRMSPDH